VAAQPTMAEPARLPDGLPFPAGQSGSPVIFAANEFTPYRSASGPITTGPVHELIGVYSGRIHEDSDIGVVWKRDAVREIVEYGIRPEQPWVPPLEVPLSALTDPSALSSWADPADAASTGLGSGRELASPGRVENCGDQ
jgi:hypothetical protein